MQRLKIRIISFVPEPALWAGLSVNSVSLLQAASAGGAQSELKDLPSRWCTHVIPQLV